MREPSPQKFAPPTSENLNPPKGKIKMYIQELKILRILKVYGLTVSDK